MNDIAFAWRLAEGKVSDEWKAICRDIYDRCLREFGKDDKKTLAGLGNLATQFQTKDAQKKSRKWKKKC